MHAISSEESALSLGSGPYGGDLSHPVVRLWSPTRIKPPYR